MELSQNNISKEDFQKMIEIIKKALMQIWKGILEFCNYLKPFLKKFKKRHFRYKQIEKASVLLRKGRRI